MSLIKKYRKNGIIICLQERRTEHFLCFRCEKTFVLEKVARRHIELKVCLCRKCKQTRAVKDNFYCASCLKSCVCEVCMKTFKTSKLLRKHKIVHSSSRPFTCGTCQASFKRKYTLRRHLDVHSAQWKEIPM